MANRKRPNRVNPHPARRARRLGGLVGGTSYVGLTIGIVAASASTEAESLEASLFDANQSLTTQASSAAPKTLAFSLSGGAEPVEDQPSRVVTILPAVASGGSPATTVSAPRPAPDQSDPTGSTTLPSQTPPPLTPGRSGGSGPTATSTSTHATTTEDGPGSSATTTQPTTTLLSSTAEPVESTNAPTTSVPLPTSQAPSTEPNFAPPPPPPPEPPIEIESGAS